MNSLAHSIIDVEPNPTAAGERYFVATTNRGPCVVNYTPEVKDYVGGPFLTWDGAYAYIDIYLKRRRSKQWLLAAGLSGLAAVSYLALS